ncbi:MAG: OmpP1/FadL family transporter [Alphaproteobacteria bacterium]
MTKKLQLTLLTLSAICLGSTNAKASGYNLNEFSATNLGRSFAGTGVVGDDYSAIAFNPAGMVLKGTGAQVGISEVEMHSNTEGGLYRKADGAFLGDKPKGKIRYYATLPHAFSQYKINDDDAVVGFGMYTPFGLASVYNGDWFGASHGVKTELEVIDFAAGGAYRLTNKLTAGATIIARYVHGDLINETTYLIPGSRNRMDLDGWGTAYNFGLMYEFTQNTRLGVAYRLNSAHTVKGKHTIYRTNPAMDGTYDGRSQMTLPNQLTISGYHRLNEKFGLSGSARWTKWNIFDNFVLESSYAGGTTTVIPEQWKNVWTFALGLDYYHNDAWTFRTGISEDPTPIPNAELRTARIPDTDRKWVSLGASYKYKQMTFDVGYAHLFMRGASIDNSDHPSNPALASTLKSSSKSYSNIYGVQFQYNF